MEFPEDELVDDWTLAQPADASGVGRITPLDPSDHFVVLIVSPGEDRSYDYTELNPQTIVSVGGMCLVREAPGTGWYVGEVDPDGRSNVCWGAYRTDLLDALKGL